MMHKPRRKRKVSTPKSILRLPDLEAAKSAVLNSLSSPMLNAATDMRLMNSWIGIALNLDCLSVKRWSHAIECIWNLAVWPPARSTSA
jgi:hypothetical protein